MTEALTGIDRRALLAERAEAEAQLRAAEATLGISAAAASGPGAEPAVVPAASEAGDVPAEEHPDGSAPDSDQAGREAAMGAPALDVEALRRFAGAARAADDELALAASEATGRPLPSDALPGSSTDQLGTAESAFARALEVQEDLPAAWRRLVGALISATGMAIVIGALGWNPYWLLVPIALIAIMTVDLRVAGHAARGASVEAARELASVGVAGADGLDRIRLERARIAAAETRLATARTGRDAAYRRFEELAPGRHPSEVEAIIADHEAELAAIIADHEAELAAQAAAEPDPPALTPEPPELTPEHAAAVNAEWWFAPEKAPVTPPEPAPTTAPAGDPGPAPAPAAAPPAPVRALAERLSAEGREALARIEAQLAALDRVELAKRSLEWHQSQSGVEEPEDPSPLEPPRQ
jgi:hypothetical protein